MPVTIVAPDSTEDPFDRVEKAILDLEAQGHRVVDIVEFPQSMPHQSKYLLLTESGPVVERR